jgi:hypothetical protein
MHNLIEIRSLITENTRTDDVPNKCTFHALCANNATNLFYYSFYITVSKVAEKRAHRRLVMKESGIKFVAPGGKLAFTSGHSASQTQRFVGKHEAKESGGRSRCRWENTI